MIILPDGMGMFQVEGVLKYNPLRQKLKKTRTHDEFFLILDIPKNVGLYYRYWVKKEFNIFLNPPAYGEHITVLDGRNPVGTEYLEHWNKYEGERVTINYTNYIYQQWKFCCLPVESVKLNAIRSELGFNHNPNLHITFGRMR